MKHKIICISVIIFLFFAFAGNEVSAQCAMCKALAENGIKDGNTTSRTLNSGILYLLAMPYISCSVIGFLWWKNYKKKKSQDQQEDINSEN